ncbi:MAG: protease modulator HflC [Victivallales bacterium]|nr:protease modulator HflC [Victivallales bacterium]
MSAQQEQKMPRHWVTILLGVLVAIVFIITIISYQVKTTEYAVITTLGKISGTGEAGLNFRWPYPIQSIYKFDNRVRCFEGSGGKIEETMTKDAQNVLVGIYIAYKITDAEKFYTTWMTVPRAEESLSNWMRSDKAIVIGKHNFDELINTDPEKMKLSEIEKQIRELLNQKTEESYGVKIIAVGVNSIGIPENTTSSVFARMVAERQKISSKYRSEGESRAKEIRSLADAKRMTILTNAEAKAKTIRAGGDAEAAKYYSEFKKNPQLAAFLRKLDAMKKIMGRKTTLILDTDSAPFDILRAGAENINSPAPAKSQK